MSEASPSVASRDGGEEVLRALAGRPGGRQLTVLAGERDDVALVGGAVRDLLLRRSPRELDVVLTGDAATFARELASALGANTTLHGRFGTAAVEWEAGRIDVAERRAESYPAPGALPEVRPGSVAEDLGRRDFTVNAIAVTLAGPGKGCVHAAPHALEDLAAGRLRVLHDGSFSDDPTRLLRMARYGARLGLQVEPHTSQLAANALAASALASVSRARVGAELRLALGEVDASAALEALDSLGVLRAIDPELTFDGQLARLGLGLLPDDGRPDLLLMACVLLALAGREENPEFELFELLDGLEFTAGERERVMLSALDARSVVEQLTHAGRPSELHRALRNEPLEAVALAGALGGPGSRAAEMAAEWLDSLRNVRLAITGEDLLAAGVASGPELGRRLEAALARRLDGELQTGAQAELDAALEASV